MARTVLTYQEKRKIEDVLHTVFNKEEGHYIGHWDDAAVAKHLGGKYSSHHVRYIRYELFPESRKRHFPKQEIIAPGQSTDLYRLNLLENLVNRMNERLSFIEKELGVK